MHKDIKRGFKLFRKMKDGSYSPLFINKSLRMTINGEWLESEYHPTKGFATRQGWHLCQKPVAPHLAMNPKNQAPRVWLEVEFTDYTEHEKPENQGGAWVLAQKMRIIRECTELNTTGYETSKNNPKNRK